MRVGISFVLVICVLACGGCAKKKSTDELVEDLKPSHEDRERIIAVRSLSGRKGGEAAKVVPALIEALKDQDVDVRLSAAIKLGTFGEQARDAIPALKTSQHDHDARVRHAAGVALARIDPKLAPKTAPGKAPGK